MVGSIIITVTAIKIFLTNAKLAFGSEIVAIAAPGKPAVAAPCIIFAAWTAAFVFPTFSVFSAIISLLC